MTVFIKKKATTVSKYVKHHSSEVLFVETAADENTSGIIVHIVDGGGMYSLPSLSLVGFQKQVPEERFVRISKSCIVNRDYVTEISAKNLIVRDKKRAQILRLGQAKRFVEALSQLGTFIRSD